MSDLYLLGCGKVGSNVLKQALSVFEEGSFDNLYVIDTSGYVKVKYNQFDIEKILEVKKVFNNKRGSLSDLVEGYEGEEPSEILEKINNNDVVIDTLPSNFKYNEQELNLESEDLGGSLRALIEAEFHNLAYDVQALYKKATVVLAHKDVFASRQIWDYIQSISKKYNNSPILTGTVMAPTRAMEVVQWLHKNNISVLEAEGIVNGTTNLMLERMLKDTYTQALKYAQDIDCADPNPSDDVEGHDAMRKMVALAMIMGCYNGKKELYGIKEGVGNWLKTSDSLTESSINKILKEIHDGMRGIDGIDTELVKYLEGKNYIIKLIGRVSSEDGIAYVGPEILQADDPYVKVKGTTNILNLITQGRYDFREMIAYIYQMYANWNRGVTINNIVNIQGKEHSRYDIEIIRDGDQLSIKGPGAGVETAKGLLDAAKIATQRKKNIIYRRG